MNRFGKLELGKKKILEYRLALESFPKTGEPGPAKSIQVGFLLFEEIGNNVRWKTTDLFVPHSLVGAGILARFLESLIRWFKNCKREDGQQKKYEELHVVYAE